MNKQIRTSMQRMAALAICFCIFFLPIPTTYAYTDDTEPQIADLPKDLVIHLGPTWAGAEFELQTDMGLFPQPITVNEEGILRMSLGGSATYTLYAITVPSLVAAPVIPSAFIPNTEETPEPEPEPELEPEDSQQTDTFSATIQQTISDIPAMHLFMFVGGLTICIVALVIMQIMKNRRVNDYDDDYDDM